MLIPTYSNSQSFNSTPKLLFADLSQPTQVITKESSLFLKDLL